MEIEPKTEILTWGDGDFKLTSHGLVTEKKKINVQELDGILEAVFSMARATQWIIGDTLLIAERTFGRKFMKSRFEEASRVTGIAIPTLKNMVNVCHRIPLDRRREGISFTHHLEVAAASKDKEVQDSLLDEVESTKMPVKELRSKIYELKEKEAQELGHELTGVNHDRPFGLIDAPTEKIANYPLAEELTRFSAYLEGKDLAEIPKNQRKEMLGDLLPLMVDTYTLLGLEISENPDFEHNLPFSIHPTLSN